MDSFVFFSQASATAAGFAALGMFSLLSLRYRIGMAGAYLPYLCALLAQSSAAAAGLYLSAAYPQALAGAWRWQNLLSTATTGFFAYAAPAFILAFANIPFKGSMRRLAISLAAASVAASPLALIETGHPSLPYVPSMVALASFLYFMLYGQIRLIRAYPRIRDRLGRIGLPAIVLYNAVAIAVGVIESLAIGRQARSGGWPAGAGLQPLSYLAWHALTLAWALKFSAGGSAGAVDDIDGAKAERYGLTARELELCRLLARGEANKEIAARLGLSPHTVRNHVHNVFEKTKARNRVELCKLLGPDSISRQ
jgi:DNA-binding CsgD family transcriptional regulator